MDTQRFEHAIALRDSGRVEEALAELTALIRVTRDPEEKASLFLNQARCYRLLERSSEGKQSLTSARRMAPKTQALLYIEFEDAVIRWHEGRQEESLKVLNRIQESYRQLLMSPEHRELYEQIVSSRGMLLTELRRHREAAKLLEESCSFDSRVIEKEAVLRDLGLCYLELGDRERAKGIFEECLREKEQGVYATAAHYYLGTIYFEQAAFAKAQLEFEACLPGCETARIPADHIYAYLARTARHLGLKDEAERYNKLAKR